MLQILLLAMAVSGLFLRPSWLPNWCAPVICAIILLAFGGLGSDEAVAALRPLFAPLAFLLLAVPLAMMLDRSGFFGALAAVMDRGRNPLLGLWVLAACVTTFLNLDASVVLLTPLYIRIARCHGLNAKLVAFQPVVLACLASSALPISNLTNLIAAQQTGLGVVDFVVHLGPASLAAVIVGWFGYRRISNRHVPGGRVRDPVDSRALRRGTPVVVFVVLGFTFGGVFGVPAWAIALMADIVLLTMTRRLSVSDVPFGAAALASGLAVLALAAAPHLNLDTIIRGSTPIEQLRTAGLAMIAADTVNNLPALLVSLPVAAHHHQMVWPLLFGVNFGPVLVLHGSLAGLLWRNTALRLGVHMSPWEYTKFGVVVGLPALVVGLMIAIIMNASVS